MKTYNKLVRDRIPEIIKANGQTACFSVLDETQFQTALKKKLCEEVGEYLDSADLEELADILEVIDALAQAQGSTFSDILKIKAEKAAKKGRFEKRLFLKSVDDT